MRTNSRFEPRRRSIAVLWDESFLWGVMAIRALTHAGFAFELVRSADVRKGCLEGYAALFVPGGWASNKVKTLGAEGIEEIRRFVREGGSYVGFCGGAGLATMDGIGLLPIQRRATKERVPSFSGPIRLTLSEHSLWHGIRDPVFHAWWPSQFVPERSVSVIATYGEALPDSFSSDVNVGDATSLDRWQALERIYGINLDPQRLHGEPAVLEGTYGDGRVVLSLIHFDTPDDRNGELALKNMWRSLAPAAEHPGHVVQYWRTDVSFGGSAVPEMADLVSAVNDLIELGARNFLWFRRNPLLLQWRRGVRGLECCTLQIMVHEIVCLLAQGRSKPPGDLAIRLDRIRARLLPFLQQVKGLLIMERFAMQNGHITYERCDDPDIRRLRNELFSDSKSHGGRFKEIVDEIDVLLYELLRGS